MGKLTSWIGLNSAFIVGILLLITMVENNGKMGPVVFIVMLISIAMVYGSWIVEEWHSGGKKS